MDTKHQSPQFYFEIYVNGCDKLCVVKELDISGKDCWPTEEEAVNLAKQKKKRYPNIDFRVIKTYLSTWKRELVFDTSKA